MSERLPAILSCHDFPRTELDALRLDGEVYRVDNCAAVIDEISTPILRAGVLSAQLPGRLIAEQRSAAWVWGALHDPPRQHQACADSSARSRPAHSANLLVREVVISRHDIAAIGGLSLTTPIRTAIDLARFTPVWRDGDALAVFTLMKLGRFAANDCQRIMNQRRNLPNKLIALRRLTACDPWRGEELSGAHAIDVVNGVDAAHRIEHAIEVGRIPHLEHEPAERKAVA